MSLSVIALVNRPAKWDKMVFSWLSSNVCRVQRMLRQ